MAFRDDKDALVERLTDLERDLKEAREGLDRKDEELRRLRERMGGLDAAPRRARPLLLLAVVSFGVVGAGAAFWSMRAAPSSIHPMPAMPAPPELPLAAPLVPQTVAPIAPVPEAPPAPSAELTWKATVRSAQGTFASTRAGTRCDVEVEATGGAEVAFHRVAVRCGDAVLYDSRAPVHGTMMSQTSGRLTEQPAKGGTLVYQLVYQDTGTRSLDARPQLEIGTEIRSANSVSVRGGRASTNASVSSR